MDNVVSKKKLFIYFSIGVIASKGFAQQPIVDRNITKEPLFLKEKVATVPELRKLERIYSKLKMEHNITYTGAIEAGACDSGINMFIAACDIKKETLTSKELMEYARSLHKQSSQKFELFAPHLRSILLNMLENEITNEKY